VRSYYGKEKKKPRDRDRYKGGEERVRGSESRDRAKRKSGRERMMKRE